MRFAIQQRNKAEKQTGQGPTKTTTNKICHGHSGKKPLCRNSQKDAPNELVATQKSETRVLNPFAQEEIAELVGSEQWSLSKRFALYQGEEHRFETLTTTETAD